MDLPKPVEIATPFFVLLIIIEMLVARYGGRARFEARDTMTSLLMGFGSTIAGILVAVPVAAMGYFVYQYRIFDIGWTWWAFVVAFILDDMAYYWFHRFAHRVRWFWASHVIHHSSQHYNLTTALRQTWTGFFSLAFAFRLPLLLIGFPWEMLVFVAGLNLVGQFWIHTEAIDRLPRWFEFIMNTPSHHRVHHATNPKYLDSNYAGVFIIWDRMFGTFVEEDPQEKCRYGIVRNLGTFNPLKVAFHEWWGIFKDVASAKSLKEIFGFMFMPPGWSPDGSRDTSDTIKEKWRKAQEAKESA
ncbi:MAG: sterol desaturase family protein [Sphingomonadales bacterium]|jgi:sterol desaturase/sphingolipid hydroxylase (fatty acid hydroxylase superfamily)